MSENQICLVTKQVDFLTVQYAQEWFQEDIENLSTLIFSQLKSFEIQEKIVGADRENIRFSWQNHYFILNFDCYSQSCWLEGQDDVSTSYLENLCLEIKE